uniref:Uncharacterized protein n=1 Tax=viral metagenome TaxID=1070528 RepID=A0A6M3KQH7_9ZZZZ
MAKSNFDISLPDFYTDPYFNKSQASLSGLGEGLLTGDVPEAYRGIGEVGGSELERMLSLVSRDITKGVDESLARRNVSRGGIATSLTSKSIADASTKLRWSDFNRAMAGKQWLLGTGINTMSGVGSSALSYGGQKNQFGLNKAGMELQIAGAKSQEEAAKNKMWADILSSTIGTIGSAIGMASMGKSTTPVSVGSASGSAGISSGNKKNLMSLGEDYFNFG